MNIGSKLIFSFVLVTLLPTILIAYITTSFINTSNKEDAQAAINHNLKAAWMQYYARAYQMQYGMLQASTEAHIKDAVARQDHRFLRNTLIEWKKNRPYVDLWTVVDRDSRVIASLTTDKRGALMSLNGLTEKSIRNNTSYISTELIPNETLTEENLIDASRVIFFIEMDGTAIKEGEFSDGMMLVVVTPVIDRKGWVTGAIITGDLINNDPFVPDSLAESIPGSLATITMGNVQISTNVKGETGERTIGHLLPGEVLDEIVNAKGFKGETSIARKEYLTAFDPILNSDGKFIGALFVGVPKERFIELQKKNMKAVATIAMVGLFLAAGFAIVLTYLITRPIKSLTRKAQLVSTGNLNVKPGGAEDSNDEIADLSRTFDMMVKSLRENEERIRVSQDNLSRQKNLIESIINSLPYCLYVIERNMGIVAWNRHSVDPCPICNCSSTDSTNLNFIGHLENPELQKGLEAVINGVFETGEDRTLEQKITSRADGKELVLRTSVFPISSSGGKGSDYVVWMAEDITKQKELEASIISSEKLAAIGQLAAGIAHEVNNPLGGILNCLYNFKNKKLTDARKAEYLDFMEEGIKRVQNIVRQLLDFSQQHTPELVLTDVNTLVDGLIPLFLHIIKGKEIRFISRLGEGLPKILIDKHQIEQILVNLILNAIQAVKDEGIIEVSTRMDGNWYAIHVTDNGCGIPSENINRIFDPFFTTKGVGKGTGLGLSVSRGIIERHKGRIEVESQAGKGSTFKVFLPIPF